MKTHALILAAVIALLAAPTARADPGYITSANDDAFMNAITGDGISIGRSDAIIDAHAVCAYLETGSGSMWDAIQGEKQMHPSWGTVGATHFVDRSIQNYCPDKAPF